MTVAQINYAFDQAVTDPEALLDRYTTLTGWGEGLIAAGASRVFAFQRFGRDASFTRNGVEYVFRSDGGGSRPRPWIRSRRLHDAVARADPDIAHVNGLDFAAPIRRLRRVLGPHTAIVVQDHGGRSPCNVSRPSRSLAGLVSRPRLRGADGFLFTAPAQAEPWRRAGIIGPEQPVLQVLESSTSLRPMPRAVAAAASSLAGSPAALWVGRLNANKDPLTVLDGFEQSLAHLPQAVLTMIHSEDDLLTEVRARLNRPALHGRVRLVGRIHHDALAAYYSAADLFVLGSHHEGSGYALIEACACGAIPVVTAIPSFRAITADGSIGGLWTPGDAADCARALVDIGRQDLPALRLRVEQHFSRALSWETVGREALAAYAALITVRRSRARPPAGIPS